MTDEYKWHTSLQEPCPACERIKAARGVPVHHAVYRQTRKPFEGNSVALALIDAMPITDTSIGCATLDSKED